MSLRRSNIDINALQEKFNHESDTVVAILSVTLLDQCLENLLTASFVEDKKVIDKILGSSGATTPLASFSARIDMAYCLGLIPRNVMSDLHCIRKIRNQFAHQIDGFTFKENRINDLCNNLDVFNQLRDSVEPINDPRSRFILTVVLISTGLLHKAVQVLEHRPKVPDEFRPPAFEADW